jgi:hypothetical protein
VKALQFNLLAIIFGGVIDILNGLVDDVEFVGQLTGRE